MGLVNGRPGEFTTLQLCNVLWIPASASSSSAVGWLTAPRPLRSQTGRSENSQFFNFAMFWGLVQATLGSSSSFGGWWAPLLRLINEQLGYSQFRTLQCFGDCRLPIRVLQRLGGSMPHGRGGQRPGGLRNSQFFNFAMFGPACANTSRSCSSTAAGLKHNANPYIQPLRSQTGWPHYSQLFNFVIFWGSLRRLPPTRVRRRLHGCRGPNLHTAGVAWDPEA